MFVLFAVVPLSISAAPKNRSAMQVPGYRAVRAHYRPMNKMIMSVRINGQPANLLVDTGSNQMILNRIFRIEEMDFRDRRLKARWVAPSKAGAERVSIHLFHSAHSVDSLRSSSALSLFPVFLVS
jgi:hypothetical protein